MPLCWERALSADLVSVSDLRTAAKPTNPDGTVAASSATIREVRRGTAGVLFRRWPGGLAPPVSGLAAQRLAPPGQWPYLQAALLLAAVAPYACLAGAFPQRHGPVALTLIAFATVLQVLMWPILPLLGDRARLGVVELTFAINSFRLHGTASLTAHVQVLTCGFSPALKFAAVAGGARSVYCAAVPCRNGHRNGAEPPE